MSHLTPAERADFAACQAIHAKHGKSYYFATRFFPEAQRLATFALYAFFRIPDDIVDQTEANNSAAAKTALLNWKQAWEQAYQTGQSDHPVLRATAKTFHTYQIPFSYSEAFLGAMVQDTEKSRYATYQELEHYMYGSAVVVGLMMTHVIGFSSEEALPRAQELGEAMQLTNFLRDIREDLEQRNRIYLPEEDLQRFGVTEEDLREHRMTDRMIALLRFEIDRCDRLYTQSARGIPLLHPSGRKAVAIASRLYQEILRKIEGQSYNIFRKRARTSTFEKALLSLRVVYSIK